MHRKVPEPLILPLIPKALPLFGNVPPLTHTIPPPLALTLALRGEQTHVLLVPLVIMPDH
jgi:hypothetical protein